MKITARIFIVALCVILTAALLLLPAAAEEHLDEIQNFTIDITVNDDATLTMDYHVEWKVLDSESEGPLEWVRIGIQDNVPEGLCIQLSRNLKRSFPEGPVKNPFITYGKKRPKT